KQQSFLLHHGGDPGIGKRREADFRRRHVVFVTLPLRQLETILLARRTSRRSLMTIDRYWLANTTCLRIATITRLVTRFVNRIHNTIRLLYLWRLPACTAKRFRTCSLRIRKADDVRVSTLTI